MVSHAMRLLKDLPIRRKLLVSYVFFISVPLMLFSFVSYLAVSRYYEDQVLYSASQTFDQAFTFLSSKVNALDKASDIVYFSTEVQTALSRPEDQFRDNFVQQQIDMNNVDNYFSSFQNSQDVYRVTLFVPGWNTYANQGVRFDNFSRLRADPAFERLFTSREKVTWYPPDTTVEEFDLHHFVSVISMYRKIRDMNNLTSVVGAVRISILESLVRGIVTKANATRNGVVYIENELDQLVSASTGVTTVLSALREAVRAPGAKSGAGWSAVTVAGLDHVVQSRSIPGTDWTLVSAIPQSDIRYQSERLRDLLLLLVVVIGALAYISAALLTRSTLRRLTALTDSMNRLKDNRALPPLQPQSRDEIGVLTTSFRAMAGEIQSLLEAQYRAGQELKSAELRALQAQINPHFLSNTLELINWQAMNRGVPEIAELSRALARFYSLSLNNGRDIVPIADELDHVRTYVEIQNRRFANRIRFEVKAPRALVRFTILKLLLQPLVENSIHHGILEKGEEEGGLIRVTVAQRGPDLVLTVEDDGVGMTEERRLRILSDDVAQDHHGYGVKNIHSRIVLHYGEGYGLTFRSALGQGTTVTMRIPATKQ